MSTAARAGARRRPVRESRIETLACDCGATVRRVSVDGGAVLLDPDVDAEGDIAAFKVGGQWRFVPAGTAPGPTFGYRTHRCRITTAAVELSQQAHSRTDTAGPCGRCWSVTVPHRYGPNAEPLCPDCRKVVDAAWEVAHGRARSDA